MAVEHFLCLRQGRGPNTERALHEPHLSTDATLQAPKPIRMRLLWQFLTQQSASPRRVGLVERAAPHR